MGNIFTTENISKYNTKGRTSGVGEYVKRNNAWSMNIRPEPFYKNYGDDSYILRNDFLPDTQYIVNLWIDGDDVISSDSYRVCGMTLYYTDGSSKACTIVGGDGVGFQHINFATDKTKSVRDLNVYYYMNAPVYYRLDSYIAPLQDNISKVNKSGIISTGDIFESQIITNASFGKEYIQSNQFIEI
jgi:hypothetical protein